MTKDIKIPKDTLEAVYVILCSVPYSMTMEVYDEAKEPMREAQQWVLDWGKQNNVDSRGRTLKNNKRN